MTNQTVKLLNIALENGLTASIEKNHTTEQWELHFDLDNYNAEVIKLAFKDYEIVTEAGFIIVTIGK
jgi:hypothetical protein